ncbi:MAG: hypothetical protein LBP54_01835, partial [Campylobacteraceae bacterium]|nr:hypothetical protein [Campylobacteraceae bacterium]
MSADFIYQKEKFIGIGGGFGLFVREYDEMATIKAGIEKSLESSLKGVEFGFETTLSTINRERKSPYKIIAGANLAHYWGYGEKELRFIPEIG